MTSGLLRTADLSLPNELALLVFDQLADDNETLCTLARTCRGMQHLAEEHLYRTIELHSVKDLHAIIAAFTYRHERVRAVQTLKILYQYRPADLEESTGPRTIFNECVAHMVNLRHWHVESPFDNFNWEKEGGEDWVSGDMQRFQRALETACVHGPEEASRISAERRLGKNIERTVGLALLECLTIHSHGASADFWELDGFHCLFRHPNLRHLHVSCVAFPVEGIPELESHIRTTPLISLVFDECELEPKSLLSILRTPLRLKQLTMGENVFNVNRSRRANPVLSKNTNASLEALQAVAHSLESLTHLDPGWRADVSPHILSSFRPTGKGMREFHELKYLECDTNSFLHRAIIMNRDLAPPNLETLRIRRHWDVAVDLLDQPPSVDHYMALPSLSTLELMQSSFLWHEFSHSDYICEPDRLRNRHALAYKLSQAGVNLKVLIEMHRDPSLIPPYLHGENTPIIQAIYDANVVGFHRHISTNRHESDISGVSECLDQDEDDTLRSDAPALERSSSPVRRPSVMSFMPSSAFIGESSTEPPETDQLDDTDIQRLTGETRRALTLLKQKFIRRGPRIAQLAQLASFSSDEEDGEFDENDELEVDDLDEDADMELDLELDDDGFGEDGVQIYEHNGELFIEVYDTETDDSDEMDEDGEELNDDLD